jgi:hypothetical protein
MPWPDEVAEVASELDVILVKDDQMAMPHGIVLL